VGVPRQALSELRSKYDEMLAMRVADALPPAQREGDREVRARMRRLAERFPGSLREIDDLPLEEISRRIHALDLALAAKREAEPWMEAVALFHARTRGILVAKRWLRRRKPIDAALQQRFERELVELPFPEDSRAWAAHLALVASPPRGRLLEAVFARMGREMQLPAPAVRALVFPRPSR
jgi:hypothetical protein